MNKKHLFKGYLFIILSALIFGFMPLMIKFIYQDGASQTTLVFFRNVFSAPVLAILALSKEKTLKIKPAALPHIGIMALANCMTAILLFSSYNFIPSGTATVFHFIYPAIVVLGEFIFLKRRMDAGHLISVALCVLGIALFYNPGNKINLEGSFYALLSGVTYATYIVLLSGFKYKKETPNFILSFYLLAISSVFMFCVCFFAKQFAFPATLSGWVLAILASIALNAVAVVLFQAGTFIIGGGRAAVLSTFEPITSVICGIIIFSEPAGVLTFIGTALVIFASILIALCDMKNTKI